MVLKITNGLTMGYHTACNLLAHFNRENVSETHHRL